MRTSIVLLLLLLSFGLKAQEAKALFNTAPESLLPLLTAVNKADFIDFLDSNMQAKVKNRLGTTSQMTDLTEDYVRIQMTENSVWEMKRFSTADSTNVICVVSTACAPVCDSAVRFFSADWKELPASQFLQKPDLTAFLHRPDSISDKEYVDLISKLDVVLVNASLSKDESSITFTLTTPQYLGETEAKKYDGMLKPVVVQL